MKLSYKWLKEYVNTKFSAEDIAEKLTMAGLEVEEVVSGFSYSGVVVGKVLSVDKHPNADKLRVAKVQITPTLSSLVTSPGISSGTSEGDPRLRKDDKKAVNDDGILQIVCGASNLAAGQTVPVAIVGAKLGDYEIGKASLRGVDSHGMICSEKELGLGEDHGGIMVLEKAQKIGEVFVSGKGSDKIIDVNILANRPDCMSVIGLAREVSVLTHEKLNIPKIVVKEAATTVKTKVTIEDPEFCARYMSRVVTGVTKNETPTWMKERLLAAGVRSIDLLVDISNYVMLEYGQPLHFFDLDKVVNKGSVEIIVRRAHKGEKLTTLDGNRRTLTEDMLVIASKKEAIALAGVMGGATTEIDKNTKDIFIEAAVFDKASIRRTSRALGLRSEAVARYEKGIALTTPEVAINRAAQLLTNLAGGTVEGPVSDTLKSDIRAKVVALNPSKLNAFLGTSYIDAKIQSVLTSLGFKVVVRTKYHYEVTVPSWRVDIDEPVDLYEEVCRVIGFDSVPSTLPFDVHALSVPNETYEFAKRVRLELAAIGLTEIMTYSFAGEKELRATDTDMKTVFEVANPLVKEQRYMRTSLVPKMLDSLAANQYFSDTVRFFEIGKTFHRRGKGLPNEKTWISVGVIGGANFPIVYKESADFYDVKGAVDHLLRVLGIENAQYKKLENNLFVSGQAAEIFVGSTAVGVIGTIIPKLAATFGLKRPVAIAQLDEEKLLALCGGDKIVGSISKYQQSLRDISFVIPETVEVGKILEATTGADVLLKKSEVVDIYKGKPLKDGEKSITVRLTIVSNDRTLTDNEVEKVVSICQNRISKLGGIVRGNEKKA